MYEIGSTVMYGSNGICLISGKKKEKYGKLEQEFYILNPIFDNSITIYVPVGSEDTGKMNRVLDKKQILSLIKDMPNEEDMWIDDDNKRRDAYKKIVSGGNRKDLIGIIRTLFLRKNVLKENGKKLHVADEGILQKAEKKLYDEFAVVLDIDPKEVIDYIKEHM